jgi:putative membrane protein
MNALNKFAFVMAGSAMLLVADGMMSKADRTFAMKAAQGGMAEVQLGKLAVDRASSQKVKDFGQKMVDDHSKASDQLKSIAAKENLTLPTSLSTKDQALKDRLSNLSGPAFDKAYMNSMVKDHETDIAEFQKEANSGSNPDLKNFASQTLPTLQQHLDLAKSTASSVGAM